MNSILLEQGIKFKKYQNRLKKKVEQEEVKNGLYEGFTSAATETVDANALQELQSLQAQFNTLLDQYNTYNSKVISTTQQYIGGTNDTASLKNKNVFVSNLVNNPESKYVGCYLDKPPSTSVKMIPALSFNNSIRGADGSYVTKDLSTQYGMDSSSSYQNIWDEAFGPQGAFDQNPGTFWHSGAPLYDGATGNYTGYAQNQYNDYNGNSQMVQGEWIWVKLPGCTQQTATSYTIVPRSDLIKTRSPNSWVLCGSHSDCSTGFDGTWTQIDQRSGETFTQADGNTYTIAKPGAYNFYCIFISKVGNDVGPYEYENNRTCVQFSIDFYMSSDATFTNDMRAMIWDGAPYGTMEDCKKKAMNGGYQYFGLQDLKEDGTAQCSVSNDLFKTQIYGDASRNIEKILIWSSNTAGHPGAFAIVSADGRFLILDTDGTILASFGSDAPCSWGGRVDPNSIVATYGGNCGVPAGNVSQNVKDRLNAAYAIEPYPTFSVGIDNGSFSDVAPGCKKNWDTSYLCGNVMKTAHIDAAEGQTYVYDCKAEEKTCQFLVNLHDNGDLCSYKGLVIDSKVNYWCSTVNRGNTKDLNPDWVSTKGLTGRSYLTTNQQINSGQWIGSDSGSCMLTMQEDGNLVLFACSIKNNCVQKDNNTYGLLWTNAVYELSPTGDTSLLGKTGYIDENGQLSEYPADMVTVNKSTNYQRLTNTDSAGNDLPVDRINMDHTTFDNCKATCDNHPDCFGFVFDSRNNANNCFPKSNAVYPQGPKQYLQGVDLYYLDPSIQNNASCGKDVVNIDSLEWSKFQSTGTQMTPNTTCGLSKLTAEQIAERDQIQNQLSVLAQEIVDKTNYLESLNTDMTTKMGVNRSVLDDDLAKYKKLAEHFKGLQGQGSANINGIVSDSDIRILQENYTYMFWSILAIAIVIATIHIYRKN